jgi:hypothetical protein
MVDEAGEPVSSLCALAAMFTQDRRYPAAVVSLGLIAQVGWIFGQFEVLS